MIKMEKQPKKKINLTEATVNRISSLIFKEKCFKENFAGQADWGPWVQTIFGILLVVLAIVLAIEGVNTIAKNKK